MPKNTEMRDRLIKDYRLEGLKLQEIADIFNITRQRVSQIVSVNKPHS